MNRTAKLALLVVLIIVLFIFVVPSIRNRTAAFGMNVIITDTSGKQWNYVSNNPSLIPLTITVGGIAISSISFVPVVAISYTGTIQATAANACTGSTSFTDTAGIVIASATNGQASISSSYVSGSNTIFLGYATVLASQLSTGPTGTFTLTGNAGISCSLLFTDGSNTVKGGSASASVTYTYTNAAITAVSVSLVSSTA